MPAVVKKVLRAAGVPEKVRAVAVPPTVTLPPEVAAMEPSAMERVTVSEELSTSAKGVPVKVRLPATSSVTVNEAGVETVGASLAPVKLTESVLEPVVLPSDAVTVKESLPEADSAFREVLLLGWKRYLPVEDST